MSSYMGLDLSYSGTGVYVLNDKGEKTFSSEIKADKEYDNDIVRVEKLADELVELAKQHNPVLIMLEDYFNGRQPKTVIMLAVLGTMVRYKLLTAGFTLMTCAPTQVKKFVTGKGAGSKDVIIKHVFKRWVEDTNSNNVADACGLAHICLAVYKKWKGEENETFAYEKEVVDKILKERQFYMPKVAYGVEESK